MFKINENTRDFTDLTTTLATQFLVPLNLHLTQTHQRL